MKAEKLAGLPKIPRGGWHRYRRLFSTASKGEPLKNVMDTAGWLSEKMALMYRKDEDEGVLSVPANRRREERKEATA